MMTFVILPCMMRKCGLLTLSCTEWIYETAGLTQPQDTPLEGATLSIIARDPGSDEVWLQVRKPDPGSFRERLKLHVR